MEKSTQNRVYTALASTAAVAIIASQVGVEFSIKHLPNPWKSVAVYETMMVVSGNIFVFASQNRFSEDFANYKAKMQDKISLLDAELNFVGTPYAIAAPCILFLGQCFLEKKGFTAFYPNLFSFTAGLNRGFVKHFIAVGAVSLISLVIINAAFNKLAPPC